MLEDDFTYVLRKALMGHEISPEEAAARAGLGEEDVLAFLGGEFRAKTARKLASALSLDGEAFARHPDYQPARMQLPGVERLDLPFGGERVNAWLVRKGDFSILFDAGYDARDLLGALGGLMGDRDPSQVYITHTHRDHVGALEKLVGEGIPVYSADIPGTQHLKPGDAVTWGALVVRACDLSGHASPSLGVHIEGLEQPVLVTGDAIFAGSIGGCGSAEKYQHALARIREVTTGLPDSTILLPGHGPATTIGEERRSNPFFAGL